MIWALIKSFIFSPLLAWIGITGLVGVGCIALYLLTPSWFPARFRGALLATGIGAFVVGGFYWHAFRAGEAHMAQRLAAQDRAAWERVERGAKEVDSCNGGIDWDVVNGRCEPGSGSGAQ